MSLYNLGSNLAIVAMRAVRRNLHDDYDVADCFWRIKQYPDKQMIQEQRQKLEADIACLNDRCKQLGELLKSGEESDVALLENLQADRNKAKQKLASVNEQAKQQVEDRKMAIQELEDILCLPQVIAVRAETPDVIAFTVVATTEHKDVTYHLGTWDIFFGNVESARHLTKGSGDRDSYRVKRVVSGLTRASSVTEFHNWDDDSFCFGTNYGTVNNYAKSRDFLHGIQAMIMYLSTIKLGKRQEIPKAFKIHKKEGES